MNRTEYKEISAAYLAALPSLNRSEATQYAYNSTLSGFEEWLGGNIGDAEEITAGTVIKWRCFLFGKGLSSNTIAHYLTILHKFYAWSVKNGFTDKNPVEADEIPSGKVGELKLLNLSEILQILNSREVPKLMTRDNYVRNRAIVLLLTQTGIRNSELRALTPADLNFDTGTISVRHGKGDKRRVVSFPALSRSAVLEYMNSDLRPKFCGENDLLFGTDHDENGHTTHGKLWHEISRTALLEMVNKYTFAICGKEVGVHSLRHAFASLCDHQGVPLRQIQVSMGHASPMTTDKVYISILDKSQAANTVNNVMDHIAI